MLLSKKLLKEKSRKTKEFLSNLYLEQNQKY